MNNSNCTSSIRIYQLEKSVNQTSTQAPYDAEASPLLNSDDPDETFKRSLDSDLEKICSFYQLKELEIYGELGDLMKDEGAFKEQAEGMDMDQLDGPGNKNGRPRSASLFGKFGLGGRHRRMSTVSASIDEVDEQADSDDDADENTTLHNSGMSRDRWKSYDAKSTQSTEDLRSPSHIPSSKRRASQAYDDYSDHMFSSLVASGMTLKKRTISLYVSLCELKSFVQLNKTGFSKVLKKYDKTLDRKLKNGYIKDTVTPAYPFRQTTMQHLDENIQNTEKAYADVITKGDLERAKRELRLHLREHVVWERNTVWREMIGIERKAQAANLGIRRTMLGDNDPANAQLQGDEPEEKSTKEMSTPFGKYRCPIWLFSTPFFSLIGNVAVFVVLLLVPIMKKPEQQNCLAMLVFVSLLWATEVSILSSQLFLPYSYSAGHTSFRNRTPCPFIGCGTPNSQIRPKATPSTRPCRRREIHLCVYVDTGDHATTRWLHHRSCIVQIPHRKNDGHVCPQQSRHPPSHSPNHKYVCRYDPKHVD